MWHWSAAQWVLRLETDFRVGSGQCFPPDKQQCRTWRKRRADALSPEIGAQDQKNEGGHKVVAVEGGCECGEWKRRSGKTFSFFFPFFFFSFFSFLFLFLFSSFFFSLLLKNLVCARGGSYYSCSWCSFCAIRVSPASRRMKTKKKESVEEKKKKKKKRENERERSSLEFSSSPLSLLHFHL